MTPSMNQDVCYACIVLLQFIINAFKTKEPPDLSYLSPAKTKAFLVRLHLSSFEASCLNSEAEHSIHHDFVTVTCSSDVLPFRPQPHSSAHLYHVLPPEKKLIEDFLNGGNLTRWLTVRWNGSFWKFSYLYLHLCVRRQHAPPVSHLFLLPEEAAGSHSRHGGHHQHREPAGSDEEPAAQRHSPADSGHHHPTPGLQHGDQERLHLRTRAPHLRGGHVRTSHIQDEWTHLRCLSQLKRCHLSSSISRPCPDTLCDNGTLEVVDNSQWGNEQILSFSLRSKNCRQTH
ncbi:hypothetical protein CDAR_12961 [Caerostris darwini]|uniref:Uncharacterized protein n=1 Tax=Caerostris darwini TaxID=1538125 RepID=A0AAV4Q5T0_9ARAC|nr:hypothetical protein CDAR_12961 [Caerostris darwini]